MTTFVFRRLLLLALVLLFAVATVLYSAIWMFAVRHPFVDFGFWGSFSPKRHSFAVAKVEPDSAAAKEGLRTGDRIVAINGRALDTPAPFYDALIVGKPGDAVQFTIERPGAAGQITVREVIQPLRFKAQSAATAAQLLAGHVLGLYPLLFLVVGLPVLFLRIRERNAWLLALLFGGFIVGAPLDEAWIPQVLRGFA